MKNYIIIALLLAGCASDPVPVKREFPEAPKALQEKCAELATIQGDKPSITDMLKVVVSNYTLYYQCSTKVEGWTEWYTKQKQIFDEVDQ